MFRDVPVGEGYLELQIGASSSTGAYARGEGGYRVLEDLAAFGFVEANQYGVLGGLGARLRLR